MPTSNAESDDAGRRRGTMLLGISLTSFAATALWLGLGIGRTGIGGNHDPGPHFFPVLLATLLLVFGFSYIVQGVLIRRGTSQFGTDREGQAARPSLRWLLLLAVLIVYVVAIGWIGFSLSTFLVAAGLMMWLGNRWWIALFVSAALVIMVQMLFVHLFHVQLPTGELGLPF